jgi:hypothetical protein
MMEDMPSNFVTDGIILHYKLSFWEHYADLIVVFFLLFTFRPRKWPKHFQMSLFENFNRDQPINGDMARLRRPFNNLAGFLKAKLNLLPNFRVTKLDNEIELSLLGSSRDELSSASG